MSCSPNPESYLEHVLGSVPAIKASGKEKDDRLVSNGFVGKPVRRLEPSETDDKVLKLLLGGSIFDCNDEALNIPLGHVC